MLTYDYSFLPELTESQKSQLESAYAKVQADLAAGKIGFAHLAKEDLTPIISLAAEVRTECDALLVIGIGGSDLGARAVHRALNHQFYNLLPVEKRGGPQLFFLGDTTDPVAISEVLDVLDLARTRVVIISKSGNTIEQMSTLVHVRARLIEAVGEAGVTRSIIMVTDEKTGTLRQMVDKDGYRSLVVPGDVGGRFSVFSTVGLFPLAVVGIDIQALVDGAAHMDAKNKEVSVEENPAALFAIHQYVAAVERGEVISVLMPYSYSLREVGFWYRQLWAESLGKRLDLEGNVVEVGPTPIAAVGPTDQHSQVQLYSEGPRNKIFTFIAIEKPGRDSVLPLAYPELEGVSYLEGHTFQEIVHAEQQSTALALQEAGRPTTCIYLEKVDAHSIGCLLEFFEWAVTYAGALYNINTFDQPGVERSKQLMYGMLGREGYEKPQGDFANTQSVAV